MIEPLQDDSDGGDPIFDEGTDDVDSQTTGLFINLAIGIPFLLICLFAFDPLRRRAPSIFETRRKLNEEKDPLDYQGNRVTTPSAPSYKPLGWLLPTLRLDLETITDTHGLDAALFLRYHRLMIAFFSCYLIPTFVLIPIYATAKGEARGLNKFSTSNIPPDDNWRFWLVLLVEYVVVIFVCYFLFYNFTLYCRDRRRYRAARHPANYAVLVQDVPKDARSEDAVRDYWDRVFPGEIASVFYVHDARRLDSFKEDFWSAVAKRERAEYRAYALEQRLIQREQKREERMQRKALRRRRPRPPSAPSSLTDGATEDSNRRDVAINITQPEQVHQPRNLPNDDADAAMRGVDDVETSSTTSAESIELNNSPICGFIPRGPPKEPSAAIKYWELAQRKAWAKVKAYQERSSDGHFAVTTSAIVVFKSRRVASVAAQTNFSRQEHEWRVSRAPEPNAINWGALCVTGWTVYIRQAITTILSAALTLLWVFPVTIIMGLVSISSLAELEIGTSKPFKFVEGVENMTPVVRGFVESYLPTTVLSVFLGLVPKLFELFVSISRIVSNAERDRLVRDWYFTFVTFSNWLFVAFSGTILKEMSQIAKDPGKTVDILARNIPKQAAFMMNFIIFSAFTEIPRELLQIGRVFWRWFKLKYTAKTQREREEAETGEIDMGYVETYSMAQLVSLLGLVYCTIQPLITVAALVYFIVSYVVFKYNLCFSFYNDYQDGGRMYGGALYGIWIGLFSHLLTMIGIFGLNKSLAQSVLIIIPAVLSVLFVAFCRKSFDRVLEHGSALETQDRVEKLEGVKEDVIEDELAQTYIHPGWEELPEYGEIENQNGVVTEEDERRALEKQEQMEIQKVEEMTNSELGTLDQRGSSGLSRNQDFSGIEQGEEEEFEMDDDHDDFRSADGDENTGVV